MIRYTEISGLSSKSNPVLSPRHCIYSAAQFIVRRPRQRAATAGPVRNACARNVNGAFPSRFVAGHERRRPKKYCPGRENFRPDNAISKASPILGDAYHVSGILEVFLPNVSPAGALFCTLAHGRNRKRACSTRMILYV